MPKTNNNGRIPKLEKPLENRIVGHEMVRLDQLLAHPNNWRLHPKYQQDALAGLIDDIGFIRSVLVNKTTGTVIDGHLRVALASRSGVQELPVEYIELTEEQEIKALALLDPIAGMAETDREKLEEILEMVTADNDRVRNALAHIAERNHMKFDEKDPTDPEPIIDKKDQLQEQWKTELGQVWQLGQHKIICGDCIDQDVVTRLMGAEKVDQVLTDPPYGVDYITGKRTFFSDSGLAPHVDVDIKNDALENYRTFYAKFMKVIPYQDVNTVYIFTGGTHFPELALAMEDAGLHRSLEIIWVKNVMVPGHNDYWYQHELIIYGWKGRHKFYRGFATSLFDEDTDPEKLNKAELVEIVKEFKQYFTTIIRADRPHVSIYHPTTKPIPVVEKLMLDGSDYQAIVYDPFLGSGTTLIAAEVQGRRCRAIEIDPGYVAVALERWKGLTNQEPVLLDGMDA